MNTCTHHPGPYLYYLTAPNGATVGMSYRDEADARAASERTGDPLTRQCIPCGALLPDAKTVTVNGTDIDLFYIEGIGRYVTIPEREDHQ